ncbi:MAG TPA: GNAT family N-acetyltransferase [Mucilaginibacter sp.]
MTLPSDHSLNDLLIKRVTIADTEILANFSRAVFFEAFRSVIEEADIADYEALFTLDKTLSELTNPCSEFYFALLGHDISAYLKLNFDSAQTMPGNEKGLEIERIYVSARCNKKGIGTSLLDFSTNIAFERDLNYVWLSVWEHNHNAIKFYRRNGFKPFGSHEFAIGNDDQKELLMKKVLAVSCAADIIPA